MVYCISLLDTYQFLQTKNGFFSFLFFPKNPTNPIPLPYLYSAFSFGDAGALRGAPPKGQTNHKTFAAFAAFLAAFSSSVIGLGPRFLPCDFPEELAALAALDAETTGSSITPSAASRM